MPSTWYLHNATTSVTGTLPGASTLSTAGAPTVTATGAATNRTMDGTKGTSQVGPTLNSAASTAVQNNWFRRFVSPPLAAQTIPADTNTLSTRVQAGVQTTNTISAWAPRAGYLAVWRPSTGAVVGVLFDLTATSTPGIGAGLTETWSDGPAAGATLSANAVTCQTGDVLVYELWGARQQTMATTYVWTLFYDGTNTFTSEGAAETSAAATLLTRTDISLDTGGGGTTYTKTGRGQENH